MANNKSNYFAGKMRDQIFLGTAYSFPGTLYLALYTTAPGAGGGGTEVTGGSYVRKSIVCNATNWTAGSNGQVQNALDILFVAATGSWGTIAGFALFDAASGGNLIYWGTCTPQAVASGQTAKFAAGQLTVTEQ